MSRAGSENKPSDPRNLYGAIAFQICGDNPEIHDGMERVNRMAQEWCASEEASAFHELSHLDKKIILAIAEKAVDEKIRAIYD